MTTASAAAFLAVVAHQPRAQAPRLHADDRVGARIERRVLVEDLHADDVFLELVAAPGERLEDDEAEEALEPIDLPEGGARQNPIELLPARFVAGGSGRTHRQPQY